MRNITIITTFLAIAVLGLSTPAFADSPTTKATVITGLASMPLAFTENQGQWDEQALFRTNAGGATMWFTKDGAYYQFTRHIPCHSRESGNPVGVGQEARPPDIRQDRKGPDLLASDSLETMMIKANFVGSNPQPTVYGEGLLEYKCNYFLGNDPAEWRTDVPNYQAVVYEEVYPGIDLKYYGNGKQMEYDFIVSPGANPSQIMVSYEGARSVSVNSAGELVVETDWGEVVEQRPVVYQMSDGDRVSLASKYFLKGDKAFGFELPDGYNADLPLVIDPTLVYSTYLGGSDFEYNCDIAVDGSGNAYIAGRTNSTDFLTEGEYQTDQGFADAFVTKLNGSGNALVYSTYLGGNGEDGGYGVAVDGSGNAYITGFTASSDFPTAGEYQTYQGSTDAFVTKLSISGNALVYSTYLGGSYSDDGYGIAVDGSGNAYIAGRTYSSDFPTEGEYQTDQGDWDAFVTKLNGSGNALVYSTYLGGNGEDDINGIVVDSSGNAYITGWTYSTDFPTEGEYQTNQDTTDVFVTKLNSSGSALVYSTYLGGSSRDYGSDIAVDGSGNAYITGWTFSSDFPTEGEYQTDQGFIDAFVTKLNGSGNALVYSTYLGGSSTDQGQGIAVDGSGNAYITGETFSTNFPTEAEYQAFQGKLDAFVTKLNGSGNAVVYSTYLGGSDHDRARSIAVDDSANAYITGETSSTDFPTEGEYQTDQGDWDAFVTKLSDTGNQTIEPPGWSFTMITGSDWTSVAVGLWALREDLSQWNGELLASGSCTWPFDTICTYEGTIPNWAYALYLYLDDPGWDVFHTIAAVRNEEGKWKFQQLGPWVSLYVSRAILEIPTLADTTGTFDSLYAVVNLEEWIVDPQPLLDEYVLTDGISPDLPGFLIGTNPIVFDSLAEPTENPFSTTTMTGVVQRRGQGGFVPSCCFDRGDADDGGSINVADLTYLVDYLFFSGSAPPCPEEGDVDGSGATNVADLTYLVDYLFFNGPAPPLCP